MVDFYAKLEGKYTIPMDSMATPVVSSLHQLSHEKKTLWLSIESWLLNRDSYTSLLIWSPI